MFMQFLIERARRVTHQRGYSPLILCGVSHLEFKYPNQLMHLTRQGSVLPLCAFCRRRSYLQDIPSIIQFGVRFAEQADFSL